MESELLSAAAPAGGSGGSPSPDIAGLTADSREVRPGYLFAALSGSKLDGRRFIDDAVARGAVAILTDDARGLDDLCSFGQPVAIVTDANPRRRLALMAARFHAPQPRTIAAITGTSGKTSVAAFARQLWQHTGEPAASLGTLGIVAPDFRRAGARRHRSRRPRSLEPWARPVPPRRACRLDRRLHQSLARPSRLPSVDG